MWVCSCSACIYWGSSILAVLQWKVVAMSWFNQAGAELCWASPWRCGILWLPLLEAGRAQAPSAPPQALAPGLSSRWGNQGSVQGWDSWAQSGNSAFRWDGRTRGCLMLQPAQASNTFHKRGVQPRLPAHLIKLSSGSPGWDGSGWPLSELLKGISSSSFLGSFKETWHKLDLWFFYS